MSRLGRAFGVVIALMVVGLFIAIAGAPTAGLIVLLASILLFGVLVLPAAAVAWRSPGWTRAYNPGAAHREAKAERDAARQRDLDASASGGEEPDKSGG